MMGMIRGNKIDKINEIGKTKKVVTLILISLEIWRELNEIRFRYQCCC